MNSSIVAYKNFFISKNSDKYDIYEYNFEDKYDNNQNCKIVAEGTNYDSLIAHPSNDVVVIAVSSKEEIEVFDNVTAEKKYYYGMKILNLTEPGDNIGLIKRYDKIQEDEDIIYDNDDEYDVADNDDTKLGLANSIYMLHDSYVLVSNLTLSYTGLFLDDEDTYSLLQTSSIIDVDASLYEYVKKNFNNSIITNKKVYSFKSYCAYYDYLGEEICQDKFIVNEDLTPSITEISFINDSYIVFKDGTTYMYNNL